MTRIVFSLVIGRSKRLLVYLLAVHVTMLVTAVSLLGSSIWSALTIVLIVCSFIYYCKKNQWLKSNKSIIRVERDSDGKWRLFYPATTHSKPLTLSDCVVTQQCIILYFNRNKFSKETITIMSDSVDAECLRQLRVYCRDPKTFQQ